MDLRNFRFEKNNCVSDILYSSFQAATTSRQKILLLSQPAERLTSFRSHPFCSYCTESDNVLLSTKRLTQLISQISNFFPTRDLLTVKFILNF